MARIAGVNLPTNKRVVIALQYIHGIGKATAVMLAAQGAHVPIIARDPDRLAAARGLSFPGEGAPARLARRRAFGGGACSGREGGGAPTSRTVEGPEGDSAASAGDGRESPAAARPRCSRWF